MYPVNKIARNVSLEKHTQQAVLKEDRNIRTANLQPNKEFSNDYGYVYHFKETAHKFDFDNIQILAFERNGFRRKLIAGVYIPQNPTTIAKSTKLGSLFFHQQKNTHSTHLIGGLPW